MDESSPSHPQKGRVSVDETRRRPWPSTLELHAPWGKKPQRAAVIPPGTLSARVALLSEFCEGGQAALQREEFGNMEFVKYLA